MIKIDKSVFNALRVISRTSVMQDPSGTDRIATQQKYPGFSNKVVSELAAEIRFQV